MEWYWQGRRETLGEKTLFTTNLTWADLESNPVLRDNLKLNYDERLNSYRAVTTSSSLQGWQGTYNITLTRPCNRCSSRKSVSVTYSECVFVALGNQHAMHNLHTAMWPAWLYIIFPHYLIKSTILKKTVIEHKMCVLIFSTAFLFSEISLVLRITERDMIKYVYRSLCNVPFILVRF